MIIKLQSLSDIRGSLPLMSVIQTDFSFVCSESDGVFCQEINNEKTMLVSLRGPTATICKLSGNTDYEELSVFLNFHKITNVLSDFEIPGFHLECRAVLKAEVQQKRVENLISLSPESRLIDYENIFRLLSKDGKFEVWYPLFSRKVNNFCAFGVYALEKGTPVSCAVAPFSANEIGVIAGVYTKESHRKKGYATKCVKNLLADMNNNGVKEVYLWCETHNIKLYENIGFSVCGKIYIKKEE